MDNLRIFITLALTAFLCLFLYAPTERRSNWGALIEMIAAGSLVGSVYWAYLSIWTVGK